MSNLTIPDYCAELGIFDLNRDWPCKRAAFICHLKSFAADIERTAARRDRTRNDRTRRNLTAWVADAESRYARLLAFLPEKECSGNHGEPV